MTAVRIETLDMGGENTAYPIRLFANAASDPSGRGEGRTLVATMSVDTGESGDAVLTQGGLSLSVGQVVTATATSPRGDTSGFSACTPVTGP